MGEQQQRNGTISSEKTMVWSPELESKGWFRPQQSEALMMVLKAHGPTNMRAEMKEESDEMPESSSNEKQPMDEIQAELKAFLCTTGEDSSLHGAGQRKPTIEAESYESDGGTNYIKDPISGKWIHEALAPKIDAPNNKRPIQAEQDKQQHQHNPAKKKKRKAKFAARKAKCWIYVSGLPLDTDENEVAKFFS